MEHVIKPQRKIIKYNTINTVMNHTRLNKVGNKANELKKNVTYTEQNR